MTHPKEPTSQTRLTQAYRDDAWTVTSRKPYCVFTRQDDGALRVARDFWEAENALDYADGLARLRVLAVVYTNRGGVVALVDSGQVAPRVHAS